MLICDGCNLAYHTYCLKMKAVPEIYWYCPACSSGIRENGVQDETKDLEFLELVKRETEAQGHYKGSYMWARQSLHIFKGRQYLEYLPKG